MVGAQVDGTIVAPGEPKDWDPEFPRTWLNFHNLTGAIFQGKGVIDGTGSKWWAASCKKNKSNVILVITSSEFFTLMEYSCLKHFVYSY